MITGMGFIGTKTGGLYRMNGRRTVKKTASGNPITLTDSVENKPLGMKLYGWSKQDGEPSPENPVEIESAGMKWSTGKNLFDERLLDNKNNYDKQYQSSGFWKLAIPVKNEPVTVSVKNTTNWGGYLCINNTGSTGSTGGIWMAHGYVSHLKRTVTLTSTHGFIYLLMSTSVDANKRTLEEVGYIQVEYGSEATGYEPYDGGIPKLYGDKVGVSVRGKNLFHITKESNCDKAYDNTTKRIILPGEYLIGLSSNNYHTVFNASIDLNTDSISFIYSGKSGYGVGIGTNCQKSKTYAFSFETNKGIAYAVFYSEDGTYKERVLISTYNVFAVPDYAAYVIIVLANNESAVSGNTIWFKNIQIEESSSPTTYEPYTGGVPKPYGDKVEVVVGGANIFSFENFIALETYSDSGYDVRNIQLKPETMYYFYVPNRKSNAEVGVWLIQPNSENNINDRGFIGLTTNYAEVPSMKTDSTGILKIGCAFSLGIRDENYLNDNLIISLNPVDAYEPYRTPQSTAIVTPNGLPGIPVPSNTAGITYTDANGQAWIADEIDFARGKYIQRVWQAEFDGSENWLVYDYMKGFILVNVFPYTMTNRAYLSNQYLNNLRIGMGQNTLYLDSSSFYDASFDDKGLSNFKVHLAANPLVVMTYLDTPIERDLTSAELEEYTQLYSYKPTTVVENDSDCWMDVTYRGKK